MTACSKPSEHAAVVSTTTVAAKPASKAEQEEQEDLYAIGSWLARNLAGVKITEKDLEPLQQGLADALLRRPLRVDPSVVGERVTAFLTDRRWETAADEKRAGAPFIAAAKAEPGAVASATGVVYLSLSEGHGDPPALTDQVRLHYRGIRRDGSVLDDTYARNTPGVFALTRVIPCWTEALRRMRPGGKAKVTCISDVAYGDRGLPGSVLPGAPLQFQFELLEIVPPGSK